jgi:hypothetical protein
MVVTDRKPLADEEMELVLQSAEQSVIDRFVARGQGRERAVFLLFLLEVDPELRSAMQVVCELMPSR